MGPFQRGPYTQKLELAVEVNEHFQFTKKAPQREAGHEILCDMSLTCRFPTAFGGFQDV